MVTYWADFRRSHQGRFYRDNSERPTGSEQRHTILSAPQQWWFEQKTLNNTNLILMWRVITLTNISEFLNYLETNVV